MMRLNYRYFIILLVVSLTACSGNAVTIMTASPYGIVESATPFQSASPTITLQPAITNTDSADTFVQSVAKTTTATFNLPTLTPTINPYEQYTIDYLVNREYGGGNIQIVDVLADNSYFTRYLIIYPSDGLTIYGFMNVPKISEPPFPVIIAVHGYIDPERYTTLDYTTGYADALARSGFLVVHPNLRGYSPSDEGENLFRVGMAIDVLNLIEIIKEHGGQPGSLDSAKSDAIGLWGHSMGGGVSLRVITISDDIKAAVLYGAMSGDERQNWEAINRWSGGERGLEELNVPIAELDHISPIYFLDRIDIPVSIHHGEADNLVPIQWSLDLCDELKNLNKNVECYTYPGQPHTFNYDGDILLNQRVIDFFNLTLTH